MKTGNVRTESLNFTGLPFKQSLGLAEIELGIAGLAAAIPFRAWAEPIGRRQAKAVVGGFEIGTPSKMVNPTRDSIEYTSMQGDGRHLSSHISCKRLILNTGIFGPFT